MSDRLVKTAPWRFVLAGVVLGAVVGVGATLLWQRQTTGFRYRYVTVQDLALVQSPATRIGVVPRGSEVVTSLPRDFKGDDYGSDAWLRVGIEITDVGKQSLTDVEAANAKADDVPRLWLRGTAKE